MSSLEIQTSYQLFLADEADLLEVWVAGLYIHDISLQHPAGPEAEQTKQTNSL